MAACPQCSVDNPEGAKFCFACGTPLLATCPHCHQPLPVAEAKFCPSCGGRIEAAESEKLLKLVTVLFADVVSSTERAEKMYPDEIKELMESFFAAITPEITAEGGMVDSYAGDAVMAIFGVPVAHEDDPVRAVRAARRMIAATEKWAADKPELHKVRIRIGINTGNVLAAAGDETVRVTGDPVNVAARFESKAPVMQILIGERTARAVRPYFNLDSIGGLEMKGKSEPVPGFLVGEPKEVVEDRGIPGLTSPLIGRDPELKALQDQLEEAVSYSHTRTVTIMADAGVGKSRLSREMFLTLAREAETLQGRCLPYGDGVTLWPLIEILMSEAGILFTDPPDLVSEKISKLVRSKMPEHPERERVEHALGATFGLPDVKIDPRELFREIIDAWGFFFEALSAERALVVLIEDIHWADSTMLEVIRMLNERLARPVMFVCTARPALMTSHPSWKDLEKSKIIPLHPLTNEQSAELIDHLLGRSDLPRPVLEQILARAEGNPFYVEEILSRLIDEGYLVREGENFVASGDIEGVEIPDSVQGVILARLDLLSLEQRRLIQNAAVMGRAFWAGALSAVPDQQQRDQILAELEERGLISQNLISSMGGETEYTFKHILIRDVAYETLPRKKRAVMHVEAAEWIEKVAGDRSDELAELLAHHYHKAFDYSREDDHRQKARNLYGLAAAAACKRFAVHQGISYARTVVDLSNGDGEQATALEQLGDVYFQGLSIDGAWQAYTDALRHLSAGADDPPAVTLAAKASLIATRWESALKEAPDPRVVREMISAGLEDAGTEALRERAMLLVSRAFMHLNGWASPDESGGKDDALQALAIAKELDNADLESAALDAITYWDVPDGLYGQAARSNKQRLELISRLTDVKEICDAYIVAAWTSAFAGRFKDAEAAATACMQRAAGTDPGSYVLGLVERVHARAILGDWEAALGDLSEIDKIERDSGKKTPGFYSRKAYAFGTLIHELKGDERAFAASLNRLRELEAQEADRESEGPGTVRGAAIAKAVIHRGDLDAARALISIDPGPVVGANLEAMCELVAAASEWDMAPQIIAASKAESARAELDGLLCFAFRLEGRTAAANGDPEGAELALKASVDGFLNLGAAWDEAFSRLLLAESIDGAGREAQLRLALKTFERLGAPKEIERARSLMAATQKG